MTFEVNPQDLPNCVSAPWQPSCPPESPLEPDAAPFALSSPRQVPLPLRNKVQAELERMEDMGVISKVTQPTPWCAWLWSPSLTGKFVCVWT